MVAHTRFIRLRARGWHRGCAATLALAISTAACDDARSPVGPPSGLSQSPSLSASGATESRRIPDQYIVRFASRVANPHGFATELLTQAGGKLRYAFTDALPGFAATLPSQAVEALRRNPMVVSIQQDQIVSTSNTPWALDRIDQRSLPLSGSFSYWNMGTGVNIYIIDTGIRTTHIDFGGRAFGAFTTVSDEYGTSDCHGHGTMVASLAGGTTYGVAKGARIHSVRVMDCAGVGEESAVIAALDWLIANAKLPAVANMSLVGDLSPALNQAVANTIAAGITVTAAAGNNAGDACQYSPSSAAGAITTGASNGSDYRASFSNYGPCVDVFAPGTNITTAANYSDIAVAYPNGTSLSAPLVAGAAALFLSANPAAVPADVAAAMMNSATSGVLVNVGLGSPNRLLFVGALSSSPPPPPPSTPPTGQDNPPVAAFTFNCPRGRCTFDPGGSSDDKGIVNYKWEFGDGQSTTTTSATRISHNYATIGNFNVTLTVTDGAGQQGKATQVARVRKS